jgi:serine/threonine-protein kinase
VIAISPDGQFVAYVASYRLYLRSIAEFEVLPVPGTEKLGSVMSPAFSPDGRSLVFFAGDQTLKRISVSGGALVTVCPTEAPYGLRWDVNGIVFADSHGVVRVSPDGGEPERLVSLKDDETAYGPQILPGGRHVLFSVATGSASDRWDNAQVVVASLATGERKVVIERGSDARYVSTGHLLYLVAGVLHAIAFDVDAVETLGGAVPMVEGVMRGGLVTGAAQFDVSDSGSFVYVPGPVSGRQFALVRADRSGVVETLKLPPRSNETPRASPDGRWVAFGTSDGTEDVVWVYNVTGASGMQRVTYAGNNRFPVWSADSRRLAFQSDREGDLAIWSQATDATGTAQRLTKPDAGTEHVPDAWSPKADNLLFTIKKGPEYSLASLSATDRKVMPIPGILSEVPPNPTFSPDGNWIAYTGDAERQGRTIEVQAFPAGAKYQLFSRLAYQPHHPVWSPDGTELFYDARQGEFEVVKVTTRPTFAFGNPELVPRAPFQRVGAVYRRPFDIGPDGRFLGLAVVSSGPSGKVFSTSAQQINVVANWFTELRRRVPAE